MKMNSSEIRDVVSEINFKDYKFTVSDGENPYLQGQYYEPDVITGETRLQKTRKWMLSPHMTKSEVVQTAFKLAITSMEHRTREHFLYQGERVFSPHYDVDALVELCRAGAFDEREDPYEDEANHRI
jgi:hypothetical protein